MTKTNSGQSFVTSILHSPQRFVSTITQPGAPNDVSSAHRRKSSVRSRRTSSYALSRDLPHGPDDVEQRFTMPQDSNSSSAQLRRSQSKRSSASSLRTSQEGNYGEASAKGLRATNHKIRLSEVDVLETDAKDDMRKRIRIYLTNTTLGYLLDLLNGIFSIFSVVLVILNMYYSDYDLLLKLDLGLCAFFLADYVLRFYIADSRIEQILSWQAQLDAITILPTFAALWATNDEAGFNFDFNEQPWITVLVTIGTSYIRIFRLLRLRRLLLYLKQEQKKEIGMVFLHVLTGLIFLAAVIFTVENSFRLVLRETQLAYHEIMYFMVVTFSTVGYGDICMVTVPGKMIVTGIICLTLLYIPKWTNIIMRNIGSTTIYKRAEYQASPHICHVIVTGYTDAVSARDFLKELYHPDHGTATLHVVFLMQGTPSLSLLKVLELPAYRSRTTYLDGSPLSSHDLARAKVDFASACFILANKFTSTPHNDDAVAILKALSIKRFAMHHNRSDILVCVQFLRAESRALFTISRASIPCHLADQVISIEQVKMDIIAKSCLCPGFVTMLSNLVGSMEGDDSVAVDDHTFGKAYTMGGDRGADSTNSKRHNAVAPAPVGKQMSSRHLRETKMRRSSDWMHDYKRGSGYEIYRVMLGNAFTGVPFADASEILYRRLGIVLFAIDLRAPLTQRQRVILNPGSFCIPDVGTFHAHAYVIAEDERSASMLRHLSLDSSHRTARGVLRDLAAMRSQTAELHTNLPPASTTLSHTSKSGPDSFSESLSKQPVSKMGFINKGNPSSPTNVSSAVKKGGLWSAMRNDLNGGPGGPTTKETSLYETEDTHHFHMSRISVPLSHATIESSVAAELPSLKDHVIVIGNMDHIISFVRTLRLKYLTDTIPIVLLAEHPPTESVWSRLSNFPFLFFVRGTPLNPDDLDRAGIEFARTVVIVTKESNEHQNDMVHALNAQTGVDAEAILVRKMILEINPHVDLIVEIVNSDNLHLLIDTTNETKNDNLPSKFGGQSVSFDVGMEGDSIDTPAPMADLADIFHALQGEQHLQKMKQEESTLKLLASGQVFPTSTLDILICQSFYNPHLLSVIQMLISSYGSSLLDELREELITRVGPFSDSNLYQMRIPPNFVGASYGTLFQYLTKERGILPLGLLRQMFGQLNTQNENSSSHSTSEALRMNSYVSTNPPADEDLNEADLVFVLSSVQPEGTIRSTQTEPGALESDLATKVASQDSERYSFVP